MNRQFLCGVALCIFAGTGFEKPVWAQKAPPVSVEKNTPAWFKTAVSQRWTGDLDEMIKRRVIRALVVYSQTYYFVDRGTQRGGSYEALMLFENDLNRRLKTKHLRINVIFIPVRRDELIPALLDGRGDIAASGITVTAARDKLIDFSIPVVAAVNEVIVSGPASPNLAVLNDLSGKEVYVRKSSSYYDHLLQFNAGLAKAGKAPVKLRLAPATLEDEDLLQMLNAGLVEFRGRGRHENAIMEASAAENHGAPGPRDQFRRLLCVDDAREEPAASAVNQRLHQASPEQRRNARRNLAQIPQEHEIRKGCHFCGGDAEILTKPSMCSASTAIIQFRCAADHCARLPGVLPGPKVQSGGRRRRDAGDASDRPRDEGREYRRDGAQRSRRSEVHRVDSRQVLCEPADGRPEQGPVCVCRL
jgi:ABC-type amino acid transport substrate-binding protein